MADIADVKLFCIIWWEIRCLQWWCDTPKVYPPEIITILTFGTLRYACQFNFCIVVDHLPTAARENCWMCQYEVYCLAHSPLQKCIELTCYWQIRQFNLTCYIWRHSPPFIDVHCLPQRGNVTNGAFSLPSRWKAKIQTSWFGKQMKAFR